MPNQDFDRPRMRREATLQFGSELEEAIQRIDQGLIISGLSQSGKTVLATALTTIGLASCEIDTPNRSDLHPDLSLAGYPIDPSQFWERTQEDFASMLGEYYEQFQKLPPIVMIDEVLPEHVPFLASLTERINKYYEEGNILPPFLVWVLQGNDPDEIINGDFQGFKTAHHIRLQKKSIDPNISNTGYRTAASRTEKLQRAIGAETFTSLMQLLKHKISD